MNNTKRSFCRWPLVLSLTLGWLLAIPSGQAQAPGTGTVTGRIYNPASGEYVRNAEVRILGTNLLAESEEGGYYSIANVPAGPATVEVSYTGYGAASATLTVTAGQIATHDFNLASTERKPESTGDVIKLEQFVVSSEREGNAKAIMEQRRNMNVSTSVASDIFGDVTDGNVGEFLKFLPGVDVDYVESETRGPRLGGMDAQYVGVAFDGVKLASADANRTGDLGRATSFEAFSISSIESIEISRTTSPDMDADSPAGSINMKTRRAFDRKGRRISYNASVNLNSEEFTWNRTWGPDDKKNYKVLPNYSLEYSDVFFKQRLGVVASLSHANSYTEQYREAVTYSHHATNAADPRPMVLTSIDFKDGPKFILKDTYTVTADFKATPRLVLSTNVIYNYALGEFYNRNLTFTAASNNLNVNNGRTHVVGDLTSIRTDGLAANNARNLGIGSSYAAKETHTITLAPKFEYKWRSWTVDGASTYSRSFNNYESLEKGFARTVEVNNLTSDWTASRPDMTSSHWTIRQTSGADWLNLASFTNPNTNNSGQTAFTEIYNSELNARWVTPLKRFPLSLKFGGKWNEENRKNGNDQPYQVWRYVGPGGNIHTGYNANGFPTFTTAGSWDFAPTRNTFDTGTMDLLRVVNVAGQSGMVPRGDANVIADLFKAHPEYFVNSGSIDNYYNSYVANKRDLRQTLTAGYGMADIRLTSKLQLRAGLRWERTESAAREFDPLTAAQVQAAGYPIATNRRATTIAGINYQYFSQPRITRTKSYANYFPSVSAKYSFAKNLQLQAGYNKSISRPPVDDLNGVWSINDTTFRVTAPNAALLPEYSNKYVARLAYYFEPAGELSLTLTQNEITNLRQDLTVSADDFGYGDDPEFGGYSFITTVNTVGMRRFRSMELAYRQTLSFLPNPFRGTTVNLGYTRGYSNARRSNLAPHRATANIGYNYRKFNTRLGVVWNDDIPWSSIYGRFKRHSTQYDLSGGWQLTRQTSLFFQGRNIFNRPVRWFESPAIEGQAGALQALEDYGANWVFGIKGTF